MSRRLDPDFLALVTEHEETLLRAARLLTGDWRAAEHLLRDTLVWAVHGWEEGLPDEVALLRIQQRLIADFLLTRPDLAPPPEPDLPDWPDPGSPGVAGPRSAPDSAVRDQDLIERIFRRRAAAPPVRSDDRDEPTEVPAAGRATAGRGLFEPANGVGRERTDPSADAPGQANPTEALDRAAVPADAAGRNDPTWMLDRAAVPADAAGRDDPTGGLSRGGVDESEEPAAARPERRGSFQAASDPAGGGAEPVKRRGLFEPRSGSSDDPTEVLEFGSAAGGAVLGDTAGRRAGPGWHGAAEHDQLPEADARDGLAELRRSTVDGGLVGTLAGMPAEDRAVVVSRYYLGLSVDEIGEILGVGEDEVMFAAARAFATLRLAQ
jgi:DNA-directed RNA polymerase specialized sigma24 family protein